MKFTATTSYFNKYMYSAGRALTLASLNHGQTPVLNIHIQVRFIRHQGCLNRSMETSESGPPTQIPLTMGKWSPKDSCPLFPILGYYFALHLVTKRKRVETHVHVSRPSFSYPLSLPFWKPYSYTGIISSWNGSNKTSQRLCNE